MIGGAGIQSRGRRYDTLDIDVTPDRDEANLVGAALDFDARRSVVNEALSPSSCKEALALYNFFCQ